MRQIGAAVLCGVLAVLFFFSVLFHEKNLTFDVEKYIGGIGVATAVVSSASSYKESIEELWKEHPPYTLKEIVNVVLDFFNDIRMTVTYAFGYLGCLSLARSLLNPANYVAEDTYVPYWYREEVSVGV